MQVERWKWWRMGLLALALVGLTACMMAPPAPGPNARSGYVFCENGKECIVGLFDGDRMMNLPVAPDGRYVVPIESDVVLFYYALSHAPRIERLPSGAPLSSEVRLKPMGEGRGGYVALMMMRVLTVDGQTRIEPVPGGAFVLQGGRARAEVKGDQEGRLIERVPLGHFDVVAAGMRRSVDILQGETFVLPVVAD